MYNLRDESVQIGMIGDNILEIAAKAICSNKRLALVNGILYYVHKNIDERKIELHRLCDDIKEE
jgi:hypothetical protein